MRTPKPMAGTSDTMALFDLSDEQWDTMPRAVGFKLRVVTRSYADLLATLKQVRAILDQPVQHSNTRTANAIQILRADAETARKIIDAAL